MNDNVHFSIKTSYEKSSGSHIAHMSNSELISQ